MTFDTRLTELIALGAAVAANCVGCLEHHVGKAQEIGLPAEEVEAALEVGRNVRQGAAGALAWGRPLLPPRPPRLRPAPPAAAAAEGRERRGVLAGARSPRRTPAVSRPPRLRAAGCGRLRSILRSGPGYCLDFAISLL